MRTVKKFNHSVRVRGVCSDDFTHTKWIYDGQNGYGASIITDTFLFEGSNYEDSFEVAIIKFTDLDHIHFDLDYSTEITDDVILYLTEDEVSDILDRVDTLPAVIIGE